MRFKKVPVLLAFVVGAAQAANVITGPTKVVFVSSYGQYGNGDVIFKVDRPVPECADGYWITKSDSGYQANLVMLMTAFQSKTSVGIAGVSDQLWAGSSGKYCKLYSIDFSE